MNMVRRGLSFLYEPYEPGGFHFHVFVVSRRPHRGGRCVTHRRCCKSISEPGTPSVRQAALMARMANLEGVELQYVISCLEQTSKLPRTRIIFYLQIEWHLESF